MNILKKTLNSLADNAIVAIVLAKYGVSIAYGKIKEKAKSANMTFKDYVADEENIGHISLVFYDILPLAFKLGLRYDKFHEEFAKRFKTIRSWIYTYDDEQEAVKPDVVNSKDIVFDTCLENPLYSEDIKVVDVVELNEAIALKSDKSKRVSKSKNPDTKKGDANLKVKDKSQDKLKNKVLENPKIIRKFKPKNEIVK